MCCSSSFYTIITPLFDHKRDNKYYSLLFILSSPLIMATVVEVFKLINDNGYVILVYIFKISSPLRSQQGKQLTISTLHCLAASAKSYWSLSFNYSKSSVKDMTI